MLHTEVRYKLFFLQTGISCSLLMHLRIKAEGREVLFLTDPRRVWFIPELQPWVHLSVFVSHFPSRRKRTSQICTSGYLSHGEGERRWPTFPLRQLVREEMHHTDSMFNAGKAQKGCQNLSLSILCSMLQVVPYHGGSSNIHAPTYWTDI